MNFSGKLYLLKLANESGGGGYFKAQIFVGPYTHFTYGIGLDFGVKTKKTWVVR